MTDVPILEDVGHIIVALTACRRDPIKILGILLWEFMLLGPGFDLNHLIFCALLDNVRII